MFIAVLSLLFLVLALGLIVGYLLGDYYGKKAVRAEYEEAREEEERDRLLIEMDDQLKGLGQPKSDSVFPFEPSNHRRQESWRK